LPAFWPPAQEKGPRGLGFSKKRKRRGGGGKVPALKIFRKKRKGERRSTPLWLKRKRADRYMEGEDFNSFEKANQKP